MTRSMRSKKCLWLGVEDGGAEECGEGGQT